MTGFRMVWGCLFLLSSLVSAGKRVHAAEPMNSDDSDTAIELFTTWIRESPTADNYINRGNCYAVRKEFDKALADFSQAIQTEPKNIRPLLYRATVFRVQKEIAKALADLDLAVQIDPRSLRALQDRGSTYLYRAEKQRQSATDDETKKRMQEDYAKAMADYSKIIELYPKNPEGYLLRAEAFIVQKLYPKALDDFSEIVRLYPQRADGYFLRRRSTCS